MRRHGDWLRHPVRREVLPSLQRQTELLQRGWAALGERCEKMFASHSGAPNEAVRKPDMPRHQADGV